MAIRKALICTLAIVPLAIAATTAAGGVTSSIKPKAVGLVGDFSLTGTVSMVFSNRNFIIKEQNGHSHHLFVQKQFDIHPGDILAVTGDCSQHDDGTVHKIARRVHKLGQTSLPPPEKTSLADLANRNFIYRRVSTEGTLILVRHDELDASCTQMIIKDGGSTMSVSFVNTTNQTVDAYSLLGARLRLTGILLDESYGARRNIASYLGINLPGGFEVIKPPPTDIFDAPNLDFDSVWVPSELASMPPRRFDGVVMATWGGDQMMLAGKGYHRIRATLARPDELPSAGDHVAVVGFPDTDSHVINLIYARCKALSEAEDFVLNPQLVDATLQQLLMDEHGRPRINGYSHGRLLRIRGTILDVQPSLSLFSINDGGFTLPVDCSSSPAAIPRAEPNSKVEIVALAVTDTDSWRESIVLPQTRGLRLILRSADDLKVLAHPPWWTPVRLTAAVIALLALIILIVVANRVINRIMMRRKLAERTRLAVELHDLLSQTLAGVACQIAAGQGAISDDPGTAKRLLETAERMLESSRTELKNCLFDLRNDTVDDPDFERAIRKTLAGLNPDADISVRFNVARSQMTDTTTHAVLCIIRELVANAIRHGSAKHIRVAGATDGGRLLISVADDGCGFDPKNHPGPRDGHFGLSGIQERLASMNSFFKITSERGNTRAAVDIKLP